MTAPNKIDSNVAGLYFAEESAPKVLPGTDGADAVWHELEPNSFNDFGGDITTVARTPFSPSRQRKKGTITDLSAAGGFNSDFTQNNLIRLLQAFFFAAARQKPTTEPLNGSKITIASVNSSNGFTAASGLSSFLVNHLVLASGFGVSANNGLALVSAAASGTLTVTKTLTAEASPPSTAKIEAVGMQFASGDISSTSSAGNFRLASAAFDMSTLGLNVGEWIFVGGDAAGTQFETVDPGFARIKAITADYIDCDLTTFVPATDDGTGKTIRIFFGTVIKNESSSALITPRTVQLELQLGNDGDGVQAQYITGAFANEFTLNIPQANKLNADLAFIGMDTETKSGLEGVKDGTRVTALGEDAYNTSSDVYRQRMHILDSTTVNPTALFGYITEGNIKIANNITPNKAVGVLGAFDASAGNFTVSGSVTAYFSTLAAVTAIRNNSDVCFNVIVAQRNAGFLFDIPLLGLGGGKMNIEQDNPITLPLEMAAAASSDNYTLLFNHFPYLPSVGNAS